MDKREANARYYAAHNDRIILRESELRPSTVLELIECLGELIDAHTTSALRGLSSYSSISLAPSCRTLPQVANAATR